LKSSLLVRNIVAVVVIATIIKYWVNIFSDNGLQWNDPSQSVSASRSDGVFASAVQAVPDAFEWKATRVAFKDLWIEKEAKTEYPYVWFSRRKESGNYILCFTLSEGRGVITSSGPFFVIDGAPDQSFSTLGSNRLFSCQISSAAYLSHTLRLRLTSSLTDAGGQVIQLTW
jgi:hypothetical protein